ncbi:hypothetical protein AB0J71_02605 [Nonomuraea sp. NPDC049637]|uniref:hypothetical protein n=1 Tax=Nonomuraea sp. NPDC049637 TaxID=3154356 RepID=UPI003437C3F4
MWFDNVQVNQHTLHGWSILALGRAGKLVTFTAGLTIILDIAGQQRLTAVATWLAVNAIEPTSCSSDS